MNAQDLFLNILYGHAAGRILLRPMVSPWFSRAGGWLLNTRLSKLAIIPFVRANHIDLSQCEKQSFSSYNDFFKRKLRDGARPVDQMPENWISPCDARLSVYPVTKTGTVEVKHTCYTVSQLLRSQKLADRFEGGYLWLYRLCVDDYHRYIYPDHGRKSDNVRIPGVFHTVNPVANDQYPIYMENTREYCVIRTQHFGTIVMMEVGAMLVGKIENRRLQETSVVRGEEKGNFAFGGSTIIILTERNRIIPDPVYPEQTEKGIETKVRMGQRVGVRIL